MNVIYSGQKTFIKYVNLIILNIQEFLKGQFTQKLHCHNSLTLISFLDLDISVVVVVLDSIDFQKQLINYQILYFVFRRKLCSAEQHVCE